MAKGKYRLSQPRKSRKAMMKKIAARRCEALARLKTASIVGSKKDMCVGASSTDRVNRVCDSEVDTNPYISITIDDDEVLSSSDETDRDNTENSDVEEVLSENEHCAEKGDKMVESDDGLYFDETFLSSENSDLEELLCEPEKTPEKPFDVSGRRLVNISYFLNRLKSLKHEGFGCSFFDMDLISEKIEGLVSVFSFKCAVCNIVQVVRTEDHNQNVNANTLAVLGAVSTGIGHSQLSELFAALDIPNMSNKTYSKFHDNISSDISHENEEVMKAAGEEESKLAISAGDVNLDGTPIISVIVDGAWSKRSYRTNYNALSGVGCIIGARTKKLLYVGIRNKYCHVCARGDGDPQSHNCNKNWTSSSTAMEADIIVEGFSKSIQQHNLIYGKVIGDGDSSVYRKLTEVAPYGPTFTIEKIECRNHLLRNYINKISEISKDSQLPKILRRKVTNSDTLGRFRNAVTKAIKYRQQETGTWSIKVSLLRADILNGPKHIFGDHSSCADYFCKKDQIEENMVPDLEASGLFSLLKNINNRLAQNAGSLLYDVDTNAAESYNSVVAKFIGGKRINFSLRGSYEIRCKAAAISYNTNGNFLSKILERLDPSNNRLHLTRFTERRMKAREIRKMGKQNKNKTFATADDNYGLEASNSVPDMAPGLFAEKSEEFFHSLQQADKDYIFHETKLQSHSAAWTCERKKRITASKFGKICKLRKTTSTANTVSDILYSTFKGNKNTAFGLESEDVVISLFEERSGKVVERSGLIIDEHYPFMACSPDGLVGNNAIIEIKSSAKSGELTPMEAVVKKIIDYCKLENNTAITLKRNHNYYYQVQGLLHITQRELCYFLVYTRGGLHIEEIKRDNVFWKQNMEQRLCRFFMTCLLPELVDSRRCRQQNIREVYLS